MKPGRPSRTAEGVAVVRALEMILVPEGRRVLEDRVAFRLLGPRMRLLLRAGPVAGALFRLHERRYRGVVFEVIARDSYTLDLLERLARNGLRQLVILGAGFDATAWRADLPDDLRVYEVDHPDTQRLKQERIRGAGLEIPRRLALIPFNLADSGLGDALSRCGHDRGRPSLVTLLGVLPYITAEQVAALLREIGSAFAPGSEVVYTYFSRRVLDPRAAPPGARRVARRLRRYGEPFLSAADPAEMAGLALRAGLTQVETLDGAAMTARCFSARGDRRTVGDWINLSRAVVGPARP